MSQQQFDQSLADATAVVDAIQYARTNGLEVEFTMTFLEHYATRQYTVDQCIFHSLREWDL